MEEEKKKAYARIQGQFLDRGQWERKINEVLA